MKKEEKCYIESVLKDCETLKKQDQLTEYGEGQRNLCISLLKKEKEQSKLISSTK